MGIGGHFWDLLKPYARTEGFDFLRNKRVAIDLSFWIVQHETAIKANTRSPHLRLTFFRTINLFAKFGAFPVFVVDGTPSPLKSKARIARFFRFSGIDLSEFSVEDGLSVNRNKKFAKCVKECVELIELFGMPILEAKGEAEGLCAQLNNKGYVDACITADSDAFLFGAKCVIKYFHPNSKEPFECYFMSDIESALGLNRKHLIAISLLVGNDHDLNGVQGVGLDTALRFVQDYSDDEILNRLHELGSNEVNLQLLDGLKFVDVSGQCSDADPRKIKCSHCSFCGHPGSKSTHAKFPCEPCGVSGGDGCIKKPEGFKCCCSSCDMDREEKEKKKQENWRIKVCSKIFMEPNFPNSELVQMYLCDNHSRVSDDDLLLSWGNPKTEMLVDFLVFHLRWNPSYIRQRMIPMLSTIFLRKMANNPIRTLLYEQYEFDSIIREKKRYGHQLYVVKWRKSVPAHDNTVNETSDQRHDMGQDIIHVDELVDIFDESDSPQVHIEDGSCFLLTDENMALVHAAYPNQAAKFLQGKEKKRQKTPNTRRCGGGSSEKPESPDSKSKGVQLSITEFYRSTKGNPENDSSRQRSDDETRKGKRKASDNTNLSKSVRRRLLFD